MYRPVSFALSILVVAAACRPASVSETRRVQITAMVENLTDQVFAAAAAADFDALTEFFNQPDLSWGYEGVTWDSWAAAETSFRPSFEALSRQEVNLSGSQTVVLAPDVVWVLRRGTYVQVDTVGVSSEPIPFVWGAIWQESGGEWKIVAGVQSDRTSASNFPSS